MKHAIAAIGLRPETACPRAGHSDGRENFDARPSEYPGPCGDMPVRMIEHASA